MLSGTPGNSATISFSSSFDAPAATASSICRYSFGIDIIGMMNPVTAC